MMCYHGWMSAALSDHTGVSLQMTNCLVYVPTEPWLAEGSLRGSVHC